MVMTEAFPCSKRSNWSGFVVCCAITFVAESVRKRSDGLLCAVFTLAQLKNAGAALSIDSPDNCDAQNVTRVQQEYQNATSSTPYKYSQPLQFLSRVFTNFPQKFIL